jgi:hypothetical protein
MVTSQKEQIDQHILSVVMIWLVRWGMSGPGCSTRPVFVLLRRQLLSDEGSHMQPMLLAWQLCRDTAL